MREEFADQEYIFPDSYEWNPRSPGGKLIAIETYAFTRNKSTIPPETRPFYWQDFRGYHVSIHNDS